MINNFHQLSNDNPFNLHYSEDNLLENIYCYENYKIIDFFDTLATICYCDFYSKRNEDKYNVIKINIGVTQPIFFNNIKNELENLLSFMTNGEKWEINFYKEEKNKFEIKKGQISLKKEINSIALLSGGLDALAGASCELENNTLFVTFETNKTEANKAKQSFNVISKDNSNCFHVKIPKKQYKLSKQSTQRTRSLLFIGSALLYADYYNVNTIKIYENGIMSLNPTFSFRRRVTHTTHPRTIYMLNKIMKTLDINIKIENPFNYKTKSEVIDMIPEKWNNIIHNTKTCSKMPGSKAFQNRKKSGICQCGVCAACMLRQISILNSNKSELDDNYIVPYNISSLHEIVKYELSNGIDPKKNEEISYYKFIEKQSLLQYYKEFRKKIVSNDIYKYLELSPMFLENDYRRRYDKMLLKFKEEIDKYLSIQK